MKCLVFEIANERFAINIDGLIAVTRVLKLKPVDSKRDEILGLVCIKGVLQPVIQLNNLFNLESTQLNSDSKFISVSVRGASYTVVADKVEKFIDLEEHNYESPPDSLHSKFVSFVSPVYELQVLNSQSIYEFLSHSIEEGTNA